MTGRVDYRPGSIRTHYVGGRSPWSFQLWSSVLAQITYRNELICSFNTFCTCIRPTGRLMSVISVTFRTGIGFSFANVPCVPDPAHVSPIPAGRARSQSIMYTRSHFNLLVRVLTPITYRNELICSFNTFCTCIRPTGRLISSIPLIFHCV